MEVRPCRVCGRLFNYLGNGKAVCPACKDALEKKFQEVKEFIRSNGTATLDQISEATDVSTKQLKQWVREERLIFADDSPVGLECENCGTMIKTGRLCASCKASLGSQMSDSIRRPEPAPAPKASDSSHRMRFMK